ncbi:MAG: glycosyltransferase [Bacteroidales bacterium]|nr:glycosyltransferase [Bacteroidales bacterium]
MDASIIITCYNYEQYVESAILSAINQKYDPEQFEIIVVNDGSDDDSEIIIDKYKNYVEVHHLKNQGLEKAANYGISKSNGKYITRLDADDQLDSNYLQMMCPFLSYNTNLSFVYSDYYELRGDIKRRVGLPVFNIEEIMCRGDFLATGTLFRKNVLDLVGRYNENVINCGLENYNLILKMLLKYNQLGHHVKLPLFNYRLHNENMSSLRRDNILTYGKKMCNEYGLSEYTVNEFNPNKAIMNL